MIKRRLIIFAKAPIAGHAKSRMISRLGAAGAAQLHRELTVWMLARFADRAEQRFDYELELWAASDIDHPFFDECMKRFDITLKQQQGENLGERQFLAMAHALTESDHVVLVGSDVVSLTQADVDHALHALEQGYELAVSPAEDGGYGLIGSSRVDREIFDAIVWGGAGVYATLVANLNRLGYRWQRLAEVWDLDRPDDLIRLAREPALPSGIADLLAG